MLDTYWGEFLTSPIPLELSLSYCSYKCAYCFANLNQPQRTADTKKILRLLQSYAERETVVAMLLQHGYPVLISNRVDPFAQSNWKMALPLMETLRTMDIDMVIQTKGGKPAYDALDILKPSVWYVSIAYDDENLCKQIEPGATTLAERHNLIDTLVERGHKVVIGLNPLVPEWLPDPEPLLTRLHAQGVHGVWIERLHFNPKQSKNLTEREWDAMGRDVVQRAHKKKAQLDWDFFLYTRQLAEDIGLQVFSKNQYNPSTFFDSYHDTYAHTFPTLQDFINLLYAELPEGGLVTFADYVGYFAPQLPAGVHGIDSYLGSTARNLWRTHKIPTTMTYAQLLALIWQDGRISLNPARSPAFAFASLNGLPLVDENEMPVMVFVPGGTMEWWIDFEEAA